MEPAPDFKSLSDSISSSLVSTTKAVAKVTAQDLSFQRSLNPGIGSNVDEQSSRLLSLAQTLLNNAASGSSTTAPKLRSVDGLEDSWRDVVDVVDSLLEKVDTYLDEYTGVTKEDLSVGGDQVIASRTKQTMHPGQLGKEFRTQNIRKPQLGFQTKVENHSSEPFKPFLKSKPHASIPLEDGLELLENGTGQLQYRNPYETEISNYNYPPSMYTVCEPQPPRPYESTKAIFVDSIDSMWAMITQLKAAKEIAVDLEHHDNRSYIGIVSLMQLSTRDQDWIVDTLQPWRTELQALNVVFADPGIIKVFHGAFMDIVWLQRDLALYVVGLFDTYHAARALGYPQASLASLLSRFVNFDADKKYQMADWRIRPLPEEMFNYARSDTHFLLYIFDRMRNELVERSNLQNPEENRILTVLQNSKDTSLQRYERFTYDSKTGKGSGGWYNMLSRTPAIFDKVQFSVFRAVHEWRDKIARDEDDGLQYVMAKQTLLSVARSMPMDLKSLSMICQPMSPPVRARQSELLEVIKKAKREGLNGPDMKDVFASQGTSFAMAGYIERVRNPKDAAEASKASEKPVAELAIGNLSLRNETSRLWGTTFGSSLWNGKLDDGSNSDIRLALPLPPLTAEIFMNGKDSGSGVDVAAVHDPGALATHPYVKNREEKIQDSDVFVIKQLGGRKGKRSRAQEVLVSPAEENVSREVTMANNGDQDQVGILNEISSSYKTAERAARREAQIKLDAEILASGERGSKEWRKASRREAKRLKQGSAESEAESPKNGKAAQQEDQEPAEQFDYANAESVLHAKRKEIDKNPSKKVFDPYAKSNDAPKGVRSHKREREGKSFTFKH